MKRTIITVVIVAAIITGCILFWEYSGAGDVTSQRQHLISAGAREYRGESIVTQEQLKQLNSDLADIDHSISIVSISGDNVKISYEFLSTKAYPYLQSTKVTPETWAVTYIFPAIFALAVIVWAMKIFFQRESGKNTL